MRHGSHAAVHLAVRVRDEHLMYWRIDGSGAASGIGIGEVPARATVLRASTADIRFPASSNKSNADAARSRLGMRAAVRAGRRRLVYATPLADVWVDQDRQVRAAPIAALLDAALERQSLPAPAVIGIHLGGEQPLLLLWALTRDGTYSDPLVVTQTLDDSALAARVTGFAEQHRVPADRIGLLEGGDLIALAGEIRPYPLADEWAGRPAIHWMVAAVLAALAVLTASIAVRGWIEADNRSVAAAIARERDRSALDAERRALVRGHVVAYAQLDAARPEAAFAAARQLWTPGTSLTLSQQGGSTQIRAAQEYRGDSQAAFFRDRLARLLGLPVPDGFRRGDPQVTDGGQRLVVVYERP